MAKKIVWLAGAVFVLWAFFAVLILGLNIVAYPHGRFVSGSEEFFMADGLRGGTLVVRSYWHSAFPDGFEREYGTVTYGLGKGRKGIVVEAVKEKGQEPRIILVRMDDGHLGVTGSLWRNPDDPTVDAHALEEGTRSLEMGRRRLADWRKK